MSDPITLRPIGRVDGGRTETVDDGWDAETARIVLDPGELEPGATDGLADFSHVEVVFCFDRVDEDAVCRGTRHPRGRADWPSVGILAQRAQDRPNRIGVTVCRITGAGPGSDRRGRAGRGGRDPGARREALSGRVRSEGRGASAGLVDRTHERVLVGGTGRPPAGRLTRGRGSAARPRRSTPGRPGCTPSTPRRSRRPSAPTRGRSTGPGRSRPTPRVPGPASPSGCGGSGCGARP